MAHNRRPNIWLIRISEGREKKCRGETVFEEIIQFKTSQCNKKNHKLINLKS